MYVRLAFSVAAHLEPEILIVDEVLAVGDAEFQKKCLGKMREVSHGHGRTVLFVSHNVLAVRSLCDRGIYLKDGRVVIDAPVEAAVAAYVGSAEGAGAAWERVAPPDDAAAIAVRNQRGAISAMLTTEEPIDLEIGIHARRDVDGASVAIRVSNNEDVAVFTTASSDWPDRSSSISRGDHRYRVRIPRKYLAPGRYNLIVAAHIPLQTCFDAIENCVSFDVEDLDPDAIRLRDGRWGVVTPMLEWCEVGQ
jgi:lipopolysaccharide transport system ATP-binding protein